LYNQIVTAVPELYKSLNVTAISAYMKSNDPSLKTDDLKLPRDVTEQLNAEIQALEGVRSGLKKQVKIGQ
jgi:hypothetical protein